MWRDAGSPSSGWLCHIKNSCKFKYKLAVEQAFRAYENAHCDELDAHFLNKNIPEFWKLWNKKFNKSLQNTVKINGLNSNKLIAEEFAENFSQVYNGASHGQLNTKSEVYTNKPDSSSSFSNKSNNFDQSAISFELIDKCIRDLKLGKASGPDELMAEHLKYAHPILIYHLCILFRAIPVHSFVPNDFGIGLIVPLVKDKTGDINSVDNYRGITLTPVVAKVFECVLLSNCEEFLAADNQTKSRDALNMNIN